MKVCISLRDPATENLRTGNFRSEPRWERLALEASIHNPEVTEIYTSGHIWKSGERVTSKYKGYITPHAAKECTLLTQDWNTSVVNLQPWKAVVMNIFIGPWKEQQAEIITATAELKNNMFFVIGHPVLFNQEVLLRPTPLGQAYNERNVNNVLEQLKEFTTMDRVFFLPLPWIPKSEYADRFNNKNLLYTARLLFMHQLRDAYSIEWALKKMQEDPTLNLRILSGWNKDEVKDYLNDTLIWIKEDINQYFWKSEKFQPYLNLKDRVKIHYALDWQEVLKEYSDAKLLICHARHYGGPPMEAAMHGVPFVGISRESALGDCQDYLYTPDHNIALSYLDKLLIDHSYYESVAKTYNEYAVQTYSFNAFNQALNIILKKRKVF